MAPSQTINQIDKQHKSLTLSGRQFLILNRPLVMGVLNVTPDSFSDGGLYLGVDAALSRALRLIDEGADIIDIGGESTRPGAEPVDESEEIARVVPVIEALRRESDIPISIDTYKSGTARAALQAGADMVNDVSALRMDSGMAELVEETDAAVVLMHMQGTPENMQESPQYKDCVNEVKTFLRERIVFCESRGISSDRIIIDPGIGFGKLLDHNLQILSSLGEFNELGCPVMVGASRKSFIGRLHLSKGSADARLGGSVAAALCALQNGADIVRVHDVGQTVEAIKVNEAITRGGTVRNA